ncbi:hypothetical protein HRR81_001900 [Exophiala dermatitidis]|uniref:Uncharacterized protein n=2 Tax=Exophiala dermatitidis TaxID=5970 RepID=H6BSF5_EXODN|nr:uncharacterized protein HMPREF1120_01555 [Exophiala dermatitidis NIH/UT8656]KAJ4519121.1 hypothetical protein HRR75_002799 [Exophiala dermatitidis]EHY53361.1 hypothetical protein HMPREF1120_01555 [Exophiala dermatitidis NIH/UT8656]KAJ4529790.1 hypothetical protein HRR73_000818 [Exophiala dermatitidis]KAJ4543042.1 hypothetical protein HRR77_005303 [Exophiala dermatitidis]KAJ4557230.1 hypothetical protein HRR78_000897 [Exophiala dermatitidis]
MKIASIFAIGVLLHSASALRITKRDESSDIASVAVESPIESTHAEETVAPTNANNEYDDGGSATCNECIKDPGICCAVDCEGGLCPKIAIENGGWTINGLKITGGNKRH